MKRSMGLYFDRLLFFLLLGLTIPVTTMSQSGVSVVMEPLSPAQVDFEGMLGQAADLDIGGRLQTLPTWNNSALIRIFDKDQLDTIGVDWLGEHVGKWMYSAARAAVRTHDQDLKALVFRVADYMMARQEADGYLGTYAPAVRYTSDTRTNFNSTWDIWGQSYLILGFLEVYRFWPDDRYLNTAVRMGDLLYNTFYETGKSTAYRGNHYGLSGTILLEPIVDLYKVTGDPKFLAFGKHIIQQMEDRPELRIVSNSLDNVDVQRIGDGKIYQLVWNYDGIAKLYEITGNPDYLHAVENAWQDIVDQHLTLGASPWGGIGIHHEVFNRKGYWTPYGFVETCNTMSWIQLNRDLLAITGEAKYADIIERAAYNALLGAQYPDGEAWCYFSFPNGKRHTALYRACCRSSGVMAMEEIAPLIYGKMRDGVSINIYSTSKAVVDLGKSGRVEVAQETGYPADGTVNVVIKPAKPGVFPVFVRIPDWADKAEIQVNGETVASNPAPNSYFEINRKWGKKDEITLEFPMQIKLHKRIEHEEYRNTDMYSIDWMAMTRGPLVYAISGLIDGKEREDVLTLPAGDPEKLFTPTAAPAGCNGPAYQLTLPGRAPIVFLPWYEAGGRENGAWRLTWFQVGPLE